MHTWIVSDHPPLPFDAKIVEALRLADDALTGGGIALNLGILATTGQVYRVARAWDLADYIRATKALERLGLMVTGKRLRLRDVSLEDIFMLNGPPQV